MHRIDFGHGQQPKFNCTSRLLLRGTGSFAEIGVVLAIAPAVPVIEFSLSSTGMSKGVAQTTGPQALARGEMGFGALLIGGYAKNVDTPGSDGEAGALIGLRGTAGGLDLGISAALKKAINPASDFDRTAFEVNASITRQIGPVGSRVTIIWSPNDLGGTRSSLFAEAGATYRFSPTFSGSAAFGRRQRSGGLDYYAWNAGVTWAPIKAFSLDLRYYDTNGGGAQPFRARAVMSARARF
jgi:hypothetical protein